jgi:hypothetical protein
MVRRKELWEEIYKLDLDEIKVPLLSDMSNVTTSKDNYGDRLKYMDCQRLCDIIRNFDEPFRDGPYIKHRNDVIANVLDDLSDQCLVVLYWR